MELFALTSVKKLGKSTCPLSGEGVIMSFKKVVLCSATAAAIMLSASFVNPEAFSFAAQAQSTTSVSIDVGFNTFYDSLAPDGSWVSYQDHYVWIPENVRENWRPYTEGHWSYTRGHGWLWVSNERFGWATYHYGRWGYSREIGWYWVPGRRWAPAWVAWSHTNNAIAWAPLPPQFDDDVRVSISYNDVPDYYWQAVPASAFLSVNLSSQINRDPNYVRTVLQSSPPQTVIIQNNTVINNVINVGFVEQQTNTTVVVHEEQVVNTPAAAGKTDGATVAIFNPVVKPDTSAKPATVKTADVIAQDRTAKGIAPLDTAAGQPPAPAKAPDGATAPAATSTTPVVDPNAPKKDAIAPAKTPDANVAPAAKTAAPAVDPNAPKTDQNAPAKSSDGTTAPAVKPTTPAIDPNAPKSDATPPAKATDGTTAPAVKPTTPAVVPDATATDKKVPAKPADTVTPLAKDAAPSANSNTPKMDNSAKPVVPKAAEPKAVEPKAVEPKAVLPKTVEPKAVEPQVVKPQVDKPKTPPVPTETPVLKNTAPVPAVKAPVAPTPDAKDVKPKSNATPPAKDNKNPKAECDPATETCPPAK